MKDTREVRSERSGETRPIRTEEIAQAIAGWCMRNGYRIYSVGTEQISEHQIIVEASIGKRPPVRKNRN